MRADRIGEAKTFIPAVNDDVRCSDRLCQDRRKAGIAEDQGSLGEQPGQRFEIRLALVQFQVCRLFLTDDMLALLRQIADRDHKEPVPDRAIERRIGDGIRRTRRARRSRSRSGKLARSSRGRLSAKSTYPRRALARSSLCVFHSCRSRASIPTKWASMATGRPPTRCGRRGSRPPSFGLSAKWTFSSR